MSTALPWRRTVGAKLATISLLVAALALALISVNVVRLTRLGGSAGWIDEAGRCRRDIVLATSLASSMPRASADAHAHMHRELSRLLPEIDRRLGILLDEAPGSASAGSTELHAGLQAVRARVRRTLAEHRTRRDRGHLDATDAARLAALLRQAGQDLSHLAEAEAAGVHDEAHQLVIVQWLFAVFLALMLSAVAWLGWSVAERTRDLALVSRRVAAGDLDLRANVRGRDEIAMLGAAFDAMTASLRRSIETERAERKRVEALLATVRETARNLETSTTSILAGSTEQATGARLQAETVEQTAATVHQVRERAEQAATRALAVVEAAQRASQLGRAGLDAVADATRSMNELCDEVGAIATSITALAERAQAIGGIVATVSEIAERTDVLAVNAAIEASRAGEQARGFSVVAAEVKALASRSRRSTATVRQILGDIRTATHRAVLTSEQGGRRAGDAVRVIVDTGGVIHELAAALESASSIASEISGATTQQALAMTRIEHAMHDIGDVARRQLSTTRETASQASGLADLGRRLTSQVATTRD